MLRRLATVNLPLPLRPKSFPPPYLVSKSSKRTSDEFSILATAGEKVFLGFWAVDIKPSLVYLTNAVDDEKMSSSHSRFLAEDSEFRCLQKISLSTTKANASWCNEDSTFGQVQTGLARIDDGDLRMLAALHTDSMLEPEESCHS